MIGRLRHEIILERRTLADDGLGGLTETWTAYATVWAEIEENLARERREADQVSRHRQFTLRLRYRPDISVEDRVVTDGRILNILAQADADGRRRWTHLECEEEK